MELRRTPRGFALYKEKEEIGSCTLQPTAKGADLAGLCILPRWRRKGYGSYLLKEVLRTFGGYDRETATLFTAPLPAEPGEEAFWAKFGFAAEGDRRKVRTGLSCRPAGKPPAVRGCHLRQRRRHRLSLRHHRPGRQGAGL